MQWMLMPLRRYADFSGRSRRKEYWMFTLLTFMISTTLLALIGLRIYQGLIEIGESGVVSIDKLDLLPSSMVTVLVVYSLVVFIPSLAVTVRRFHDQGKTGWLVLLGLIPCIGGFIILALMCLDGMRGVNQYGPDPKIDDDPKGIFD